MMSVAMWTCHCSLVLLSVRAKPIESAATLWHGFKSEKGVPLTITGDTKIIYGNSGYRRLLGLFRWDDYQLSRLSRESNIINASIARWMAIMLILMHKIL